MIFNENIINPEKQNIELILHQMNLFIPDRIYDEQKILKICNLIARLNINSITVNYLFVPHISKWLEKVDIKICAYFDLDNFIENRRLNTNDAMKSIRDAFINGAHIIDINQSNYISLDDELDLLNSATSSKNAAIKLTLTEDNIKSTDNIKNFLDIINKGNINSIKTENFTDTQESNNSFKTRVSDINAIIDFIKLEKIEQNFKLDIVANEIDENNFPFYDSINKLYQSIFINDTFFQKNCTFTCGLLRLNKILQ